MKLLDDLDLLNKKLAELDEALTQIDTKQAILITHSQSWFSVVNLIASIEPQWAEPPLSGIECVLKVIRDLATAAGKLTPQSIPPDTLLH